MQFVTGDTHHFQITRLNSTNFPIGKTLTKDDIVWIAGDFGLVWSHPGGNHYRSEQHFLAWLDTKPWTTVFVDGNHENHELLAKLPVVEKFGGKMGKVNDSVFHAKRGEIYTVEDKKILTMGGASSIDRNSRIPGKEWWPGELPTTAEMEYCLSNLEKHDDCVDYIITHTSPAFVAREYFGGRYDNQPEYIHTMEDFLEEVYNKTSFDRWYFGHLHGDKAIGSLFRLLWDDIVELGDIENLATHV